MTRGVAALAVLLAVVLPGHLAAQDNSLERFQLLTNCTPIDLVVEGLSDDAADIRLTTERIRTIAESRLRAARLYDSASSLNLYVRIGVVGPAFSTEVEFRKVLLDAVSASVFTASTWEESRLGTHGGDAGYILQGLSELLDDFVLNYLRVNADACNASPGG